MRILFRYCEKGDGAANEDICGNAGQFAWVIDGATDVFGKHCIAEKHEVSMYVNCLTETIAEIANYYRPQQLGNLVEAAVLSVYNKLNLSEKAAGLPEYMLPTFAIAMVAVDGDNVYYYVLGDCFISYLSSQGVELITDKRITRFSQHNRCLLKKLHEGNKQVQDATSIYQETRAKANAPDGYPIGSICGSGLQNALSGSIQLGLGQKFIICSDGFLDFFRTNNCDNRKFFSTHSVQREIDAMNVFLSDERQYHNELRPKKIDDRTLVLVEV